MRVFALLAILALAACAEDQSHLDRWDDPRVIQFELPYTFCHCVRLYERPTDGLAEITPASLEGHFRCSECNWYDAFISVRKEAAGLALHIAPGGRILDLNDDFTTRVMPPPPPPGAVPPFPPATRTPPRMESFSTVDDVVAGVPNVVAAYQPSGVSPKHMCLWLRLSQALTVDQVFAVHNALKGAGVTCIYVEPGHAVDPTGEPFPEFRRARG